MIKSQKMKANAYSWQIGDEFLAPKWDDVTIFKIDEIGIDYVQSVQPGSRIKLRFDKSKIIPVTNNKKNS